MQGISVIMPAYNRERYILEAVQSVITQEYDGPFELVVADDGSTDKTLEVIRSLDSPIVRIVEKPSDCTSRGPAPTRNRAIAASQYPWLAFLDSDDIFLPGHLQRLGMVLENEPEIQMVFERMNFMDHNGHAQWLGDYPTYDIAKPELLFWKNSWIQLGTVLLRKKVIELVGGAFDESLLYSEDIDLILRIAEKYPIRHLTTVGSVVREHPNRSVRDVEACASYAFKFIDISVKRHNYNKKYVRKKKALTYAYLAEDSLKKRKWFQGVKYLLACEFNDPAFITTYFFNVIRKRFRKN